MTTTKKKLMKSKSNQRRKYIVKPFRIHIEISLDEVLGIQITSNDSDFRIKLR